MQFPDADPADERFDIAIAFVVSVLIGVLVGWLDSGSTETADQGHAELRRLAAQGVRRALA